MTPSGVGAHPIASGSNATWSGVHATSTGGFVGRSGATPTGSGVVSWLHWVRADCCEGAVVCRAVTASASGAHGAASPIDACATRVDGTAGGVHGNRTFSDGAELPLELVAGGAQRSADARTSQKSRR